MFGDLPDGCVAHVIGLLPSVKDVLNFMATCKRHAEIARALRTKWLQLLHTDFGTKLQVDVSVRTVRHRIRPSLRAISTVQRCCREQHLSTDRRSTKA